MYFIKQQKQDEHNKGHRLTFEMTTDAVNKHTKCSILIDILFSRRPLPLAHTYLFNPVEVQYPDVVLVSLCAMSIKYAIRMLVI